MIPAFITHPKYLYGLLVCIVLVIGNCCFLPAQVSQQQEYTVINDMSYYEASLQRSDKQKLNLVLPATKGSFPILLWIGGGAWSFVDRHQEMDLARKLARAGIAVASVGHRLSPGTWKDPAATSGIQHPEHIKDVAMAFKWLHENAAKYGYSAKNIFVGGYSSGGHLSALLSVDGRYLNKLGLTREHIKGVIPVAGTYDIAHYHQLLQGAYGSKTADSHVYGVFGKTIEAFTDASPTSYVSDMTVPMLLISESNTYPYAKVFEDKIRQSGFKHFEVKHFHDANHTSLWKNLSFEESSLYRDVIVNYILRQTTL